MGRDGAETAAGDDRDRTEYDTDDGFDVGGLVRAARRRAVLSQRELAERAGLSKSAVARMESDEAGDYTRVGQLRDALAVCGARLLVVSAEGVPFTPWSGPRNRAGRYLPAHLDIWPVRGWGWWWGTYMVGPHLRRRPDHTFSLHRRRSRRSGEDAEGISSTPPEESGLGGPLWSSGVWS